MNDPEHIRRAFNSALDFALDDCEVDEGLTFPRYWREGDWQAISRDWPEFDLSTVGVALPKKVEVAHVRPQ